MGHMKNNMKNNVMRIFSVVLSFLIMFGINLSQRLLCFDRVERLDLKAIGQKQ